MDSGLIPRRAEITELPTPADVKTVLEIVDRLWGMEIAHYDGMSLVQSVLTCLYATPSVMNALTNTTNYFRVLILSTLKACAQIHGLVHASQVCFEEDFQPGSLGFENLGEEITDEEMIESLQRCIKQAGSSDPLPMQAVLRLEFRSALARAWSLMDAFEFKEAEAILTEQALVLLRQIEFSQDVDDVLENPTELDVKKHVKIPHPSLAFAFDPYINHWRIAPHPPRPFPAFESKSLFASWDLYLQNLIDICKARSCVSNGENRGELLSLFEYVSKFSSLKRSINAPTRARMAFALCDPQHRAFGLAPWKLLIAKDVSMWGPKATEALMSNETSIDIAVGIMFEAFRVFASNPARLRRKLVHRIEELGGLQQRFEGEDAKLAGWEDVIDDARKRQEKREKFQLPLGSWTCEWCVRLMTKFMELGGELELFRPREGKYVSLYLFNLYRLGGLFAAESLKTRELTAQPEFHASKNKYAPVFLRVRDASDAKRMVAAARVQLLMCLVDEKDVEVPCTFEFPRLHYEHRFFDPFSTVWLPASLGPAEVIGTFSPRSPAAKAELTKAAEFILTDAKALMIASIKAKHFIDNPRAMEELKELMKTAIINAVAVSQAKSWRLENVKATYTVQMKPKDNATLMTVSVSKLVS